MQALSKHACCFQSVCSSCHDSVHVHNCRITSNTTETMATHIESEGLHFCTVCYMVKPSSQFFTFSNCGHSFCKSCVKHTFELGVSESKTDVQCLDCRAKVIPSEVQSVVTKELYEKYLEFCLRKFLACEPNVRSCPFPDCPYSYILENISGCEDNHFVCGNEKCGKEFCYECKRPWHPDKTCQEARSEVALDMCEETISADTWKKMNLKQCPSCHSSIEKREDGSCNHIHCSYCNENFCWLCGKTVSEMHYIRFVFPCYFCHCNHCFE